MWNFDIQIRKYAEGKPGVPSEFPKESLTAYAQAEPP